MIAPLHSRRSLSLLLLLTCTISSAFELRWPQTPWLTSRDSATNSTTITAGQEAAFSVARDICPASCDAVGLDSAAWTAYHDLERLALCNSTMLLDFTIHNPLSDTNTRSLIRSCTAADNVPATSGSEATAGDDDGRIAKRDDSSCILNGNTISTPIPLQIVSNGSTSTTSADNLQRASYGIAQYLDKQHSGCDQAISFAYSGSTVIGLFAGSAVFDQGLAQSVLQQFTSKIAGSNTPENTAVQLCSHNMSSRYTLGIAASFTGDIASVQSLVATWDAGQCIEVYDDASNWKDITLSVPVPINNSSLPQNGTSTNSTAVVAARNLLPRSDCRTIKVVSGDSCGSLANECGITGAQFTQYNPQQNLCSTLAPGQHVCCSAGTLPDYSPKPNSNGTCYTYLVQSGDTCSALAGTYSLTINQIESFNKQTWGWMGCNDLEAQETMCLSTGSPPMPAVIPNANCGPQVPGTPLAGSGTNLSTLNPCPLNACCDIWGQCGTTSEFCTQSQSPTGAPGTAAQGQNGCISNCGTDIIKGSPPSSFFKVGYFEGFNTQRPCLNQAINTVSLSGYTHIHLAFAGISTSFALDVSAIQQQFNTFTAMGGFKRILSVGGWAFCTDPSTYNIFRQAVTSGNRDTFASNIVAFIEDYDLDGVDLDWEYPAEFDIPGIPASTKADEDNFVAFMSSLRSKMPAGKTISFTAPASFWYLRAFEMAKLAPLVDYVVYMAYDLHGQWDYGNKWSDPGCLGGNCLRSHVNLTETLNALSMVTKSGVPANQIVVGVASYGRSFQMTTPGCTGPLCTYTGPNSGAYGGACTGTAGYISNAELASIVAGNATVYGNDGSAMSVSAGSVTQSYDSQSDSDIIVYDSTQWVAYMSDKTKASRTSLYQSYNFLGTADWAVDLQSLSGGGGNANVAASVVSIDPTIWSSAAPQATCSAPCILVLPPYPLGSTTTLGWPVLTTTLLSSGASGIKTITTTINVPSFTLTDISLQPVTLQPSDTATYTINPEQSITPSSFVLTLPPNEATFPPTHIPTSGASVGGPPGGGNDPNPTSSTTVAAAVFPGVIFHSTPFPITIQPQPTSSVSLPKFPPSVTVDPGQSDSDCQGPHCGKRDCGIFGCPPGGCGIFGCDGGCNIFGCGGGCGVHGCSGACPLHICGSLNCVVPGSCGGAAGGGEPDKPDESCSSSITASACTYFVSSFSTMNTWSTTTTSTSCQTSTVCDGENSKTTETAGACEASASKDYASAFSAAATTVDGTAYPLEIYPTPYPGGGPAATTPYFGFSLSSSTSSCTGCYWIDGKEVLCTEINGCTKTSTKYITVTPTPTPTTVTVTVTPSATADCAYWISNDDAYEFEVYNIFNWADDNGAALLKQERGCGALTDWAFGTPNSFTGARAYFYLPFFIKSGCVERAIVSAGGPKLQCSYKGMHFNDKRAQVAQSASYQTPSQTPTYSYSTSFTSAPSYVPQSWGTGSVVTLTETPVEESTSTYTTTVVIQNGTTVSFSGSPVSSSRVPRTTVSLTGSGSTSSRTGTISSTSSHKSATSSSSGHTSTTSGH